MIKRKRVSGLDSLELTLALDYVKRWREVLAKEPDATPDELAEEEGLTDIDAVDRFISLMEDRLLVEKSMGFSSANNALLDSMGITFAGFLLEKAKPGEEKLRRVREQHADHGMSQSNLYATLNFLCQYTMAHSAAVARLWIDAFLFRVTAIAHGTMRHVMGVEVCVEPDVVIEQPRRVKLTGLVDYVIFVVEDRFAASVINAANLTRAVQEAQDKLHGLFVAEAKSQERDLKDHIAQVIAEMFACAKCLGSRYIRGALTSGTEWIFVLLEVNADQKGGRYWRSYPRRVNREMETDANVRTWTVQQHTVDTIVAILADWTLHCAENLTDDDDWFELEMGKGT
ncbi:hypothetical protein BN946_scf184944.g1 [Trametes cinnabarina]|uniref:Uncharacterized protein n=1 Tax=Pycnoporus cinnabarinus TaxID=5643 RepID=A0A060SJF1_PYCCI|nr:hypothetical protein BN946_scf184944.g1 [Trametes cinnabarina]